MIWRQWPQWLTEAVIAAYKQGATPAMIGATISRSESVVRSKLVREGVYVSKSTQRRTLRETTAEEGF
jgi:hypothetical protein